VADEQMASSFADACIKRIEALEYEFREQQKYVKQLHEAIRELGRRITNQRVSDGLSNPTREPESTPVVSLSGWYVVYYKNEPIAYFKYPGDANCAALEFNARIEQVDIVKRMLGEEAE